MFCLVKRRVNKCNEHFIVAKMLFALNEVTPNELKGSPPAPSLSWFQFTVLHFDTRDLQLSRRVHVKELI